MRLDRQLVVRAVERFLRDFLGAAFDLEDHATRLDDRDPTFDAALTGTHAGLGRLLRERVVGEDADVDLAELLHRAADRDASCFDLARGDPARRKHLQAEVAERHFVAALRGSAGTALLHLAELRPLWREHRHDSYSLGAGSTLRCRLARGRQDLAMEDPRLDADRAVRRVSLGESVLDVRTQRVQRNAAFLVPLAAAHLGAAEAAARRDLDALGTELHRGLRRLLHGAAERNAALELRRDVLGDELRVGLGLAHLDDVQEHLVLGERLDFLLERLDARAALADHDAGTRGVDVDLRLVRGALDLDVADAGVVQLLLDEVLELQVFMQPLGVVLLFVPTRRPGLDDAEAEASRMCFLTH